MKKNIGNALALYPTPLVVVGTMIHGKPNWVLVGHMGIIGHDRIMVSLSKSHYSNQGIKESKVLSVNIVDEDMLDRADYVGCVSGAKVDKSEVFPYHLGEAGAPIIDEAPVVMECALDDMYVTDGFESFICSVANVYAEENALNEKGKIDYHAFKPVLFEMPTYEYLRTGDVIGKCMRIHK
ncbi:MAG: flavin reductase family protein [Sphaerochaetaceae bacterium]|nr:flavin reductase family protein [Sphaerochaetaceae bacterium]